MPIPNYQRFMYPLLELAADGEAHSMDEAYEVLAEKFNLTEEDRAELLPSGRQSRYENRVGWARTYLTKAGLLESPGRGQFKITPRGLDVLRFGVTDIDKNYLYQFPEFVEFRRRDHGNAESEVIGDAGKTPDEQLELLYLELEKQLAHELLERIKQCSPAFFERLVVQLLVAMGYGGSVSDAGKAVGRSGDDGIDGIIKQDRLGLSNIYIQAKRWNNTVPGEVGSCLCWKSRTQKGQPWGHHHHLRFFRGCDQGRRTAWKYRLDRRGDPSPIHDRVQRGRHRGCAL